MPQRACRLLQRQQRAQDQRGVVIVDATFVAFAVTRCGERAHALIQRLGAGDVVLQLGQVQAVAAGLRRQQQAAGQVLAAVDRIGFRIQGHRPERLQRIQFRIVQGFQEIGAGEVDGQRVATRQQGQVQRLRVDAETVPRTEPDHVATGLVQVTAVAQLAHRLVAHALQARLDVIGLDVVAQRTQALGQFAQLEDQRVTGEERIEFIGRGEALGALGQAIEDAVGRVEHRTRLALAVIQQRLLVRLEGLDQLLALAEDVAEELLVLAELAFQFFQLHQQARQLLVGLFRVAGHRQRTGDGLREQGELRGELGHGLGRTEGAAPLLGTRARLVQPAVQGGNRFDHAGTRGGIVHLQPGHQFGQHVQIAGHATHAVQLLVQLARTAGLLRSLVQHLQAAAQRRQRGIAGEEFAGGGTDAVLRLYQFAGHRFDARGVDVAQLADGQQATAQRGDLVQCLDEGLHLAPVLRLQPAQQDLEAGLGLDHRLRRLLADGLDLLVFVQHRFTGGADLPQQRFGAVAGLVAQPVVGIEQAAGIGHQALVALHGDILAVDLAGQVEQVGDATHQLGIADAAHEGVAGRTAGGELVAAERRLPDLHRVDARGFGALGMEQHHAPILHERIAVAEHRVLQHALDGVVDKQRRAPTFALVEDVQHVLAIGRTDAALELHAGHRGIEGLVLAALQVIATGEDDAMVFGQLHAGLDDGVIAHDVAGERVVDQPAPDGFAVRQHLQQQQRTDTGELELGVVQRLRAVLHRLAVDALPGLGIVLDLDGQVATGGLHEQSVEDVQVRMAAVDREVAGGLGPFEIERRRQRDIAFAARIEIGQLAFARQRPAEHAHVAAALADLERGQQLVADHDQLQQARMLVVGIQLVEVVHEAGLVEEAALQLQRRDVVAVLALHQPVQAEHILDAGVGLQPDVDVVAEQQAVGPDLDDVPANAVVLAADAEAADHLQAAVTEFGQALAVEGLGQGLQALALLAEAAAQDFVGTALGDGLVDGVAAGLRRGGFGGRMGFRHQQASSSRTVGRGRGRRGRAMAAAAIARGINGRCRPRRPTRSAPPRRPRRAAAVPVRPRPRPGSAASAPARSGSCRRSLRSTCPATPP